jgi:yeast amino acid transporter
MQGDRAFEMPYALKNRFWPVESIFLFVSTLFTFVCTFYVSVVPDEGSPSASNFFETMLCFPVFVVAYIGYKLWFRTSFQNPMTADLQSGRRPLNEEEYAFLDQYYSQPMWKRILSYVRF